MAILPISPAIVARKKVTLSKTAKNSKRKNRRMPKRINQLKRIPTLSVGLVERQTTLKNDVSRVRVRISSPNLLGLETHRIATLNPKHRKLAITPHCPTPSRNQSRTIQKTNFATTPTQPPGNQSDKLSDLILQQNLFMNTNNS